MRELKALLAGEEGAATLDVAALQVARIEYPSLDIRPFLAILDSYAAELSALLPQPCSGEEFVAAANRFLFEELGFRGNEAEYYDPRNSCLNDVLGRRTGIPITLSLVYMEIARRLERPVQGIAMPGHFLVRYDDGRFTAFIDAFHGGRLLSAGECLELSRRLLGRDPGDAEAVLKPAGKRQILLRMLNNLRGAYLRDRSFSRALDIASLLIDAMPATAEDYKQRGLLRLQLNLYQAAQEDLRRYLLLAPNAPDRARIEEQLSRLANWSARRN